MLYSLFATDSVEPAAILSLRRFEADGALHGSMTILYCYHSTIVYYTIIYYNIIYCNTIQYHTMPYHTILHTHTHTHAHTRYALPPALGPARAAP